MTKRFKTLAAAAVGAFFSFSITIQPIWAQAVDAQSAGFAEPTAVPAGVSALPLSLSNLNGMSLGAGITLPLSPAAPALSPSLSAPAASVPAVRLAGIPAAAPGIPSPRLASVAGGADTFGAAGVAPASGHDVSALGFLKNAGKEAVSIPRSGGGSEENSVRSDFTEQRAPASFEDPNAVSVPEPQTAALSDAAGGLAANPFGVRSPLHGFKWSRIVAAEGIDGAGKSTQIQRLKALFENNGIRVIITAWNSSDVYGPQIKKAKNNPSTPQEELFELERKDFNYRLEHVIQPAMRQAEAEGVPTIILADRWFETAKVRGAERGIDAGRLEQAYAGAQRPDLTLYFRVDVGAATQRVLKRSNGQLDLSDEGVDRQKKVLGMNPRAAWADRPTVKEDGAPRTDLENYEFHQGNIVAAYDTLAERYKYRVVDASRTPDEVFAQVETAVRGVLGAFESAAGAETAARSPAVPERAPSRPGISIERLAGFFRGTFLAQAASFGIQGVLAGLLVTVAANPLWWLSATLLATGIAISAGSFAGGWLSDRNPAPAIRWLTGARAVVLSAIPILALTGALSPLAILAVLTADAFLNGIIDSASYAYIAKLGGNDRDSQMELNSRFQSSQVRGIIVGPAVLAGVLIAAKWLGLASAGMIVANCLIPLAFAGAFFLLAGLPAGFITLPSERTSKMQAAKLVFSNPALRAGLLALMALTLYPLRNSLPQMFATMLLKDPQAAGWLVALFGLGGVIGSALFRWSGFKAVSTKTWGYLGAAGLLALAVVGNLALATSGVIPAFVWVAPVILAFALTNMTALIPVQTDFNTLLPAGAAGNISAFQRASVKITAMLVKNIPSLAMLVSGSNSMKAFLILGAALGAFALIQFAATRGLSAAVAAAGVLLPMAASVPAASPAAKLSVAQAANQPPAPESNPFRRDLAEDKAKYSAKFMKNMLDAEYGQQFFLRMARQAMSERFDRFDVAKDMPKVTLQGNPILENLKRLDKSIWAEDFDNAGANDKYGKDIARFLVSLSLARKHHAEEFLDKNVTDGFQAGYLHGFDDPDDGFPGMHKLAKGHLKEAQPSTTEYFLANRKKIREMKERPVAVDDPEMLKLLSRYLGSIGEDDLLKHYEVELAGKSGGTSERWDATIILLKPKKAGHELPKHPKNEKEDRLLFVIKTPLDSEKSPKVPFGRRVVENAKLFAPGTLLRAGYFERKGRSYYGYQVSTLEGKIKDLMTREEMADAAYSVGAELGRVARLSLSSEKKSQAFRSHFKAHFDEIMADAQVMKSEVEAAKADYDAQAARLGLSGHEGH